MNEQQPATPSPIRRETPGSAPRFTPRRLWERIVYLFAVALMRLVGALPPRPVEALFATLAPLAYLLWPAKRRIANSNAAVVLGVGVTCALHVGKLPVAIPAIDVHQYWHPRYGGDAAIKFVRDLIFEVARGR